MMKKYLFGLIVSLTISSCSFSTNLVSSTDNASFLGTSANDIYESNNDSFSSEQNCDHLKTESSSSLTSSTKTISPLITQKIAKLEELTQQSDDNEVFVFYTDPHQFSSTNDYYIDFPNLEAGFALLRDAYELSSAEFIMCGGDLLTNNDTKSQACYKISTYCALMYQYFERPYIIVGNHDTNYQGDKYVSEGDYLGSMLSQDTINNIMFDGDKSYYCFKTSRSSYYCFDSGIDFFSYETNPYQKEQLRWFANTLLTDEMLHKVIFIHIALYQNNTLFTPFMTELGEIVSAFNSRNKLTVGDIEYDYSLSSGNICFFQSGHSHADINGYYCGGIPVSITTSFSYHEAVTQPTFDIVLVDYTNFKCFCLRIGDGQDRYFNLNCTD